MAFSTVMMIHVEFDAAIEARMHLAAGFAGGFQAIPIGVAACAPHPPLALSGVGLASLVTEENLGDLKVVPEQTRHQFCSSAANGGPSGGMALGARSPTEFVARVACAADPIIIGRKRLSTDRGRSLHFLLSRR